MHDPWFSLCSMFCFVIALIHQALLGKVGPFLRSRPFSVKFSCALRLKSSFCRIAEVVAHLCVLRRQFLLYFYPLLVVCEVCHKNSRTVLAVYVMVKL